MGNPPRCYGALHPRRVQQGGERVHMLCVGCETLISRFERQFQQLMFPSGTMASLPITYGSALYKFACSVSWRVLTYLKLSTPDIYVKQTNISNLLDPQISFDKHEICEQALARWADVLLINNPIAADNHIVFLNGENVPHERSDMSGFAIFHDELNLVVVSILGSILVLGFVKQGPGWNGTCIDPAGSVFPAHSQQVPAAFREWLRDLYSGLQEVAH